MECQEKCVSHFSNLHTLFYNLQRYIFQQTLIKLSIKYFLLLSNGLGLYPHA